LAQAKRCKQAVDGFDRSEAMARQQTDDTASPLVTNGFLLKLTAFIGAVAVLTAILTVAGKYYGDRLAMDGHTESRETFHIVVGQDVLTLPANTIRFENQRHTGQAESVSVYLSWPEMDGYTARAATRFSNPTGAQDLIFIDFSQSVMSRDMSGRLEPIYSRLFTGEPQKGPAGLIIHRLVPKSGFGEEVILTGMTKTGSLYVVRCLLPKNSASASAADCQRDIHVGRDLTLLYRFSSTLLPDWEDLDARVQAFADRHVGK
jgi:hypothetical protein